ncbi:MAG: MlaD family protein, partial [Planctomycetaceae bacterium]
LSLLASAAFDPYCLWDDGVTFAADKGRRTAAEHGGAPTVSGSAKPPAATDAIPDARAPFEDYRPAPRWVWTIPILTLALVVWLVWSTFAARGRLVMISFADGHGIQAGDELRFHGIVAGDIESVRLADDLTRVLVEVRLTPESDALAGEGSRFWIVRPQADLTGIAGLETVVGSKYLTVIPGPADGPRASMFVGLEQPPLPELEFPGGVEVVLQSAQGTGLRRGLGVFYRDIRIGGVIETGLAGDGSAVETRVYVRPNYRHLIRERTEFWNASGVHVVGGLTELAVHIGTLESLIRGGIGISVPPSPGGEVSSGHRYTLHDRPEKDWLNWQPSISGGGAGRPAFVPRLILATLIWKHDGVVRNKTRTRSGSLLPVDGGLLGPRDLLTVPDRSIPGSASLDIDRRTISLPADVQLRGTRLAVLSGVPEVTRSDTLTMRKITSPEDGFLVTAGNEDAVLIAAARFGPERDGVWRLDASLPFDASDHGGVFVGAADGAVIGVLLIEEKSACVCPLSGAE